MLYPISEPVSDSVEDHFGYIDDRGNVVIRPSYLACSHFFEGKATVVNEIKKVGCINTRGKLVIPHQFETVGRFHAGFCPANGGYMDHLGHYPRHRTTPGKRHINNLLSSDADEDANGGLKKFSTSLQSNPPAAPVAVVRSYNPTVSASISHLASSGISIPS